MSKKSLLFSILAVMLSFVLVGCDTRDGCTISKSFGTRSVTRKDITETCIKEIAKADFANYRYAYENEDEAAKEIAEHIMYLQNLSITFGKECKEKDQTVECPDFIPESLKLTKLSGCEVYSIEPNTNCETPNADLYFSTNDDTFHTVYVGDESIIKSSDKIKKASFSSKLNIGANEAVFTWSETGEDGNEIEKSVSVKMKVVDPSTGDGEEEEEPVPEEDEE